MFKKNSTQDYIPFAIWVIIAVFFLFSSTSLFLYKSAINRWKRKSETASHGITKLFQERLQETTNIMIHLGKKIVADGSNDLQKINNHITSSDINNIKASPHLFTWVFFDWIDKTNHMRVNSSAGIFTNPPDMSHRSYTKACRIRPWTLQVSEPAFGIPSGLWLIPFGLGVVDQAGEYIGIVSGGLQIECLRELFHTEVGSDEIEFLLIDEQMNIVVQSTDFNTKAELFHQKKEIDPTFFEKINSGPIYFNDIEFFSYKKIKNFPYVILTGCNQKTILREFMDQAVPLFLALFFIGTFCLITLYLFWKKIAQSILSFSGIALKISRGELEVDIPQQRSLEMDNFAKNLCRIISYIKECEQGRKHLERSYYDLTKRHEEITYTLDIYKNYTQEKERFLSHLNDDIFSTLFIVLNYSKALLKNLKGELDFEISEENQIEFLNKIVTTIFDLQKSMTPILRLSNINIRATLESILHIHSKDAFLKKITLQYSIDPSLSDIHVDEVKFMQIVIGLLSRAIDYTPMGGRVEIKAELECIENKKFLKVAIQDNGFGLTEEDITRLLKKFDEKQMKTSFPMHLDLPTIEKLVKLHQGSISFENMWKKGTTVKIILPYTNDEASNCSIPQLNLFWAP